MCTHRAAVASPVHTQLQWSALYICSSGSQGWWQGLRQVVSAYIMATIFPRGKYPQWDYLHWLQGVQLR